jgi:hypothetical protein
VTVVTKKELKAILVAYEAALKLDFAEGTITSSLELGDARTCLMDVLLGMTDHLSDIDRRDAGVAYGAVREQVSSLPPVMDLSQSGHEPSESKVSEGK